MFISKEHLHTNLGIDQEIAAFFVNRKVPENNLYWKNRLLYISRGTGYLFIPLFFDLQLRCGVTKKVLLDEEYILLMESILHHAAHHEFEQIPFYQNIESCKQALQHRVNNKILYSDLTQYFSNEELKPFKYLGTSSKALNRGDTFLFIICYLDLPVAQTQKIIAHWYALVPSFLLMDDIMDLQEDRRGNDENAISDFGPGSTGVEKAIQLLRTNFAELKIINLLLGEYFEKSLDRKLQTPYLQALLHE